jgi:hypothetical protein
MSGSGMLIKDFTLLFQEHFNIFRAQHDQWPEVCYCPEIMYDQLMEAVKAASLDYNDPMSYHYCNLYHAAMYTDYYITILGVRIYKAKIEAVGFNVPVREAYL